MLTRLRIRNFKAWQDTGDIRLAPLTVFFGTNSSGKTSLLQFLLMLKQTVQSTDRSRVLLFGDKRSLVDLGVWPEMVFRHDATRTLGFELEWRAVIPTISIEAGLEDPEQHKASTTIFEAEIGALQQGEKTIGVKSFKYQKIPPFSSESLGLRHINAGQYELWHSTSGKTKTQPVPKGPSHFHGFPFWPQMKVMSVLQSTYLQGALEHQLEVLRYLGPLRQSPARIYAWAGDIPEDVGLEGERTVEALLAARDRLLRPSGSAHAIGFEVIIAQWLQKMGILEAFEIKPIAPHRKEYEVLVQAMGMPDSVSLTDVGFGVSQLLPVLVQLLYTERKSTLIFEQPELHLHPRAQSTLADVFIDSLQMQEVNESESPRNLQLLVESHSEHFLRRIQRRIAEEKLDPAQVALYFCKPGREGSTIEELKLDEYGNISNWPENFFGDEVGDLAAMTEAAMKRQMGLEE